MKADATVLELYAETWQLYRDCCEEIQEKGRTVLSPNGYPQVAPWTTERNKAVELLRKLIPELCLSPGARKRANIEKPAAIDPKWSGIKVG